jgi:TolB-like protein/Flp pilus assembly protein TadD
MLRAAGIEVWFDQNELVGGDAWDAKIRKQIKDCALFVPVISAATQARLEGYFRLEWKLAAQRTHTMAEAKPFLLPVVIDATRDAEAHVPEEFRAVQWTRLPGGEADGAFCARVRSLLGLDQQPAAQTFQSVDSDNSGRKVRATPAVGHRVPAAAWVIAILVLAGMGGGLWWKSKPEPAVAKNTDAATRSPTEEKPSSAAITDKSIAVLPFTNISDEKESGFFADGVQEDILTNLALVRALRVVSRTSVAQYRDTKKSMRDIGRELGVTYLLEGSVRKAAGSVRVTAQLIRAANDEHIWAKSYDRELKEVFALQSALATEIAQALQVAVSPPEQKFIERRPTENLAAYELYLKARRIRDSTTNTRAMVLNQIGLLDAALVLDPGFALAWGDLAWCHGWMYSFRGNDRTPARLEKARHAIESATRLAADAPETRLNTGFFHFFLQENGRAIQEFEKLLQTQPNNIPARFGLGLAQSAAGQLKQALASVMTAAQQDPGNGDYAGRAATRAHWARRYEEALMFRRRLAQLNPNDPWEKFAVAWLEFEWRGSTREIDAFFAGLPADQLNSPLGIRRRKSWALTQGKLAEALALDEDQPWLQEDYQLGVAWTADANDSIRVAAAMAAKGDRQGAAARLGRTRETLRGVLQSDPGNNAAISQLGMIMALSGNHAESRMQLEQVRPVRARAFMLAWLGEKEAALAEYARALQDGNSGLNVHEMRHDLQYHPLREDPRFEALLNDPKNNAPLF